MSCRCDGSGWVMGDRGMAECECRIERRRQQQLLRTGIPPRYQVKTFEQYQTHGNRSLEAALLTCKRYVEEWPTARHQGLLLQGPVGVGKTHLECAVLLECHRRWNASVAFVDLPELFARIKDSFSNSAETEKQILKPLIEADILAIDELAAARLSDWNFAMTEQIINARYNAAAATIITTNYVNRPAGWTPTRASSRPRLVDENDFAGRAAALASTAMRPETLGDRIGARMHSRVQEMCIVLELDGEDRRAEAGERARR